LERDFLDLPEILGALHLANGRDGSSCRARTNTHFFLFLVVKHTAYPLPFGAKITFFRKMLQKILVF
jgi:hypothetical protein